MKKICILTLGLFAAASLNAQVSLVKDAEKKIKGAGNYAAYNEAVQSLTPAFSNPETQNDANTYWVPGKAGFALYDKLYGEKSLGQDVNLSDMGNALLDGYKYGMMAIAVDTVLDAKGKVKTKFSKDIANTIAGHLNDFVNTGAIFWDLKDFGKAYEAYMDYVDIPANPVLGKSAPAALADSVAAECLYMAALAAWQAKMLHESAAAFDKMLQLGSKDIQSYDYAYSVAYELQDKDRMRNYSQIALDKWGTQDPRFLQRLVNSFVDSKEFDKAHQMLNKAIQSDPNNGAYYLSLAVLQETEGNNDEAAANYKKALDLDPENPINNMQYGRMLLQKYDALDEAAGGMSQAEYNKYNFENMRPLLNEAIPLFEKAYQLDNSELDALRYLKNIYYILNDGENLQRVEGLLKQ